MTPPELRAKHPLADDLEHVLDHTRPLWEELRGGRLFITGGTGFFGCWLLETLLWARARLNLATEVVVLTRSPNDFRARAPHLAQGDGVRLLVGDLLNFRLPEGAFSHVIHAASDTHVPAHSSALDWAAQAVAAAERVLTLAQERGAQKLLFTSSGAVYGPVSPGASSRAEEDVQAPLPTTPRWAYAAAKRRCEELLTSASCGTRLAVKIARGFAFVGPYLPLDGNFAAGNFMRDALRGGAVTVQGTGSAVRSYLYAADLAIWLWTILSRGAAGRAYNAGSDIPVSIAALATAVAEACPAPVPVKVLGHEVPGTAPDVYLPDIGRARAELGLEVWISLPDALRRTLRWHQRSP
jgi:dTDP-glucose 4,6-dehydratase